MRSDEERLRDVLEASEKIATRVARGRSCFDEDEDLQLALVRLLEIIGEACANVSFDLSNRHPEVPWRAAAGLRNRVIHGYFDVDLEVVWVAAAQEVPTLAAQVHAVLEALEGR